MPTKTLTGAVSDPSSGAQPCTRKPVFGQRKMNGGIKASLAGRPTLCIVFARKIDGKFDYDQTLPRHPAGPGVAVVVPSYTSSGSMASEAMMGLWSQTVPCSNWPHHRSGLNDAPWDFHDDEFGAYRWFASRPLRPASPGCCTWHVASTPFGATIFANDNVKLLFTSPMAVTKRLAAHVVADR